MPKIDIPASATNKDWPHAVREDVVDEVVKEAIAKLVEKYGSPLTNATKAVKKKKGKKQMTDDDVKELVKHMLSELESVTENLTDWESKFIESISDQFTRRGSLSPKQREILERIYTEKTP